MKIKKFVQKKMATAKYELPQSQLDLLHELLVDVTCFLDSHEIQYWIDGGTLLGSVRHQGQIPWDDDIDIGVMTDDYFRLTTLLLDAPFITEIHPGMMKIFVPNKWLLLEERTIGTPTLDIFPWIKEGSRYQLAFGQHQRKWDNCYHEEEDFFPLQKVSFDGQLISQASNPFPYLHRMYPGWDVTAEIEMRLPAGQGRIDLKTEKVRVDF